MNVEDQSLRPHLTVEMRVIEQALRQGKPVLGICLGAQLLAHVLGAPVRRHERPEIGWYDLALTEDGAADPVLGALGPAATVFQWHGRSFALPEGAVHLARTSSCEQQAFRWGDSAYGLQFHPEVDEPLVRRWLANPAYAQELQDAGLPHDAAAIEARTSALARDIQQRSEPLFENFLDLVGRPQRKQVLRSREFA
jgi:GMP synthase (glutamine-hydrolysing)